MIDGISSSSFQDKINSDEVLWKLINFNFKFNYIQIENILKDTKYKLIII